MTRQKIVYWLPRVLGILFCLFISIFAFDVFDEGYGFWETVLALIMHLVPTALVLAALLIAWRWGIIGGAIYLGLALLYIIIMREVDWVVALLIPVPLALTGLLFVLDHFLQSKTPDAGS